MWISVSERRGSGRIWRLFLRGSSFLAFFSRNCFALRSALLPASCLAVSQELGRIASCLATLFVFGVVYFGEILFLATAQRRGTLIIWESKSFEEGDYVLVYALNIVYAIIINNNACLNSGTRYYFIEDNSSSFYLKNQPKSRSIFSNKFIQHKSPYVPITTRIRQTLPLSAGEGAG